MKIDFSIIIPTYNSSGTVVNALESINNQSYKNFEVLIIDGVSTDSTLDLVSKYTNNDSRFHCISEKDRGIYDAMNKGVSLAKGDWIYFLGSDDAFTNNSILETIFTYLERDLHVIYGNVISSRFGGRYDGEFTPLKLLTKNICHQSIFFKKEIFNITDLFNLKYEALSDYDHNLKWFLNKKINKKYIPLDIAYYADGGFSSVYGDPKFHEEKLYNFFKYSLNADLDKDIMQLAIKEVKRCIYKNNFRSILYPLLVSFKQLFYAKGFSNYTQL